MNKTVFLIRTSDNVDYERSGNLILHILQFAETKVLKHFLRDDDEYFREELNSIILEQSSSQDDWKSPFTP